MRSEYEILHLYIEYIDLCSRGLDLYADCLRFYTRVLQQSQLALQQEKKRK